MSMVGAGQYLVTGGWSFWPVGDFYQLYPKWDEWHATTGEVIQPEDEVNRYTLIASYDGPDPFFVLQVTEDDPTTIAIETDVPAGTPAFVCRAWLGDGWNDERAFQVDLVMTDEDDTVWTGKFKISFTQAIRQWAGPGRVVHFSFDFWTTDTPDARIRLAYGTVVFRR